MLLPLVLLVSSSIVLGWLFAVRSLDVLDRPRAAFGAPALVAIAIWLALFLAGVILAWTKSGWLWGIGAIVVGFWVLPQFFQPLFRGIYRRPQL